jgi:hypothetical protein
VNSELISEARRVQLNEGDNYIQVLSIHLSIYLSIYLIYLSVALQSFVGPWPLFQFLYPLTQSVGLLGRGISPSQDRYLRTEQRKQISLPEVGFEPTIPLFERTKTVHAFDRAATVIGISVYYGVLFY